MLALTGMPTLEAVSTGLEEEFEDLDAHDEDKGASSKHNPRRQHAAEGLAKAAFDRVSGMF